MRRVPRFGAGLATALLGVAMLAGCSAAAPKPAAVPPSNACAWPWTVGVRSFNVSMPDAAAADHFQPLVAGEATSITVSGTYPDARYFPLSVYTPNGTPVSGNGVSSSLSDYRIAPDHGSVNPWQREAAPGGRYQVTIRSGVAPGETNALRFPEDTTSLHPGYLHYRVYLPASGARVSLPTIRGSQHANPDGDASTRSSGGAQERCRRGSGRGCGSCR